MRYGNKRAISILVECILVCIFLLVVSGTIIVRVRCDSPRNHHALRGVSLTAHRFVVGDRNPIHDQGDRTAGPGTHGESSISYKYFNLKKQ